MKRFFLIPALACVLTLSVCAQGNQNAGQKPAPIGTAALIVYYSWSGNSGQIARELQSQTGCDVFEITPVTPYTSNYNEMLEVAKREFQKIDNSGVYPAIRAPVSLEKYDTVFIVYPLWWSRMAAPMQTFLNNNRRDLAGKTIAPICTSGSSGIAGTIADAKRLCPDSAFPEALHIRAANTGKAKNSITDWLSKIGFKTQT
jgi:flavodoxin